MLLIPQISVTEYMRVMSEPPIKTRVSPFGTTVESMTFGSPIGRNCIAWVIKAVPPKSCQQRKMVVLDKPDPPMPSTPAIEFLFSQIQ